MRHKKNRRQYKADMEDKKQPGKYRVLSPASCPKRQQPEKNGAYCPFDSEREERPVSNSIHLPVQAFYITYDANDTSDEEYGK